MLAIVFSRAQFGMHAPPVTIDVQVIAGLPALSVVGLPELAVRESKDRVRSAIMSSGLMWPPGRVTVNLSPADLPKDGGRFDLPIALAILAATCQIPDRALNYAAWEVGPPAPDRGIDTLAVVSVRTGGEGTTSHETLALPTGFEPVLQP